MTMAGLRRAPAEPRAAARRGAAAAGQSPPELEALQRRADGSPSVRAATAYGALLGRAASGRVPAPVQRVKRYNHAQKLYINDEDGEAAPEGYAKVSKYFHDWQRPPWTSLRPLITRIGTDVYDPLRENMQNVDMNLWNTPVAARGGIYTEAMSTCTTIGFRGWADGQLYTALYHNTGTDQNPVYIWNRIMQPLIQLFGQGGLPPFNDLVNLKWFAIGGSETSERTCISIVQAFQMFLNPGWQREVMLFSGLGDHLTKNAMVDSEGNIVYSLEP